MCQRNIQANAHLYSTSQSDEERTEIAKKILIRNLDWAASDLDTGKFIAILLL